ncbi:MAG: YdeI/OmpD-associated family protein [Pseudomonadota bacterium]|nr:YdeI/OmpD-associated family protein [Pseudomonadota bacterium]
MTREFDAYIAKAQPFAGPILIRVRTLFHQACPDIGEALKWSHPAFEHRGIVGGMAAFKQHVRIVFWKGALLPDPKGLFRDGDGKSPGVLMVSEVSQLPPDKALLDYIRRAVDLNIAGAKVPRARATGKAVPLAVPDDLTVVLRKNKRAQVTFDALSTSQRNEYVDWLVTAKQDATRQRRLLTAIEWLSEGKPRHWQYMKAR